MSFKEEYAWLLGWHGSHTLASSVLASEAVAIIHAHAYRYGSGV